MTRLVMCEVLAVRDHPIRDEYIQVRVKLPTKDGMDVEDWFTPDMQFIRRRLRVKNNEHLVGHKVPIPALQERARKQGAKVDRLKYQQRRYT